MRQMLGTLVALAALPVFGGLLLWFTYWMEPGVEEPPVTGADPAWGT